MLEITNQDEFGKVIASAIAKVELTVTDNQTKQRWINAISKAAVQIENNGEFMTWQETEKSLLIWSQDSNEIYSSNGVCTCEAFKRGYACWHRAAARLVRLYHETEGKPVVVKARAEEIPYFKASIERKAERVGNIRIN